MTDPEITALARGYAEEVTKTDGIDPNLSASDLNGIKHDIAEYAEEIIRFLLHRFCLVEKSKLTKMYKEAVDGKCELEKMQPQNTYVKNSILMKVGMNAGCAYTLKSLFPGIAKEVVE